MALQKTTTFNGINVPNAYIRVWRFEGNKSTLSVGVEYCATATDVRFNSVTYQVPFVLTGDNPIRQAYEHLKTLPDFEGATDVLEAGQTA